MSVGGWLERRLGRSGLRLIVGVVLLVFALVGVAGCGSEDAGSSAAVSTETVEADTATVEDESESVETEEEQEPAEAASPQSCLERAGLSPIEQRDSNLWRAFNQSPFFAVFVERFGSAAKAESVVRGATAVWAAQAGPYAVTGPDKGQDDGAVVDTVASCLRDS